MAGYATLRDELRHSRNTERMSLRLSPKLAELISERADSEYRTMGEWIRLKLIEAVLAEDVA